MKIAYLVDKAAPFYVGGYEIRAEKLSASLAQRHEVRIYTSISRTSTQVGGVQYVRVSTTAFQQSRSGERSLVHGGLFATSLLSDPFTDWSPDAVIVESIPYGHLAAMRSWVRKRSCMYVLNVNEAWQEYAYGRALLATPSHWILKRLLEQGINFSRFVVAVSDATAKSLTRNYSAKDVHRVPNGIDPELLEAAKAPALSDRTYDFVAMGRLVRIKRFDIFLEALSLLRHRRSWNGKAAIVGEGPLLVELARRTRSLGLASHVEFLGLLPDPTKLRALSNSKIFVLPSEREGFSIATLEAMALGLPAVVARPKYDEVFGTSEFVRDGLSGVFFPEGDSAELARTLWELIQDVSRLEDLSKEARRVASGYTWRSAASKMEALLTRYLAMGS
jgi:glycosyltransferase involved in cell wall biosynthesis